jgi:putative ribosome biogenesis GTPase RsgA
MEAQGENYKEIERFLVYALFSELREHELVLNRLDENDEMHKKKKNRERIAASSRKDDAYDDSDDSEGMEIKDLIKLLKKKTSFKARKERTQEDRILCL